jgi:hypothetical protein
MLKGIDGSYLLDKNTAVKLIRHICENHDLGDLGLGNGFFLIPPKRLDEGFKILLDEDRVPLEKKRRIIQDLQQLGFRTSTRGKGYKYFLNISNVGINPKYVQKRRR